MTLPCETCGHPTQCTGAKRCNRCWEVEHRLPDYLKTPGGWEFIRKHLPLLDDWVDTKPDAWDYEAVLRENAVEVVWDEDEPCFCGWSISWRNGTMSVGPTTEVIARKAAALFVSLWLRGVSASFADKLMAGFVMWLELQEGKRLAFLAEVSGWGLGRCRLTREHFCNRESLTPALVNRIIKTLDPQPDEEIIVVFEKRKKI